MNREFLQSNLRVQLEKALLDENAAILKGNDEGLKELTNKRISVEKEIAEKENWWDLQVSYYEEYIQKNLSWSFYKVYADQALQELTLKTELSLWK